MKIIFIYIRIYKIYTHTFIHTFTHTHTHKKLITRRWLAYPLLCKREHISKRRRRELFSKRRLCPPMAGVEENTLVRGGEENTFVREAVPTYGRCRGEHISKRRRTHKVSDKA